MGLSKVWINCFGGGPNKEKLLWWWALINENLTCAVTTTNLARQEKYTIEKLHDWKGSNFVVEHPSKLVSNFLSKKLKKNNLIT